MKEPEQPSAERRVRERRKLVLLVDAAAPDGDAETGTPGRRSRTDRRTAEGRATDSWIESEGHSGLDRRTSQRRTGVERRRPEARRRHTPAAFSREEVGLICAAALERSEVACPRCKGRLNLRPPVSSSEGAIWQVRCETCHRCVMIKNL